MQNATHEISDISKTMRFKSGTYHALGVLAKHQEVYMWQIVNDALLAHFDKIGFDHSHYTQAN